MRDGLACVLLCALIGCSGSNRTLTPGGDDGGDDQPKIDAGVDADLGLQPPPEGQGFQIESPAIDVQPGQDKTWCYYFHTPNTGDVEVQKWESELSGGAQSVVLYTTSSDRKDPGTLDASGCGYRTTGPGPIWIYQSQNPRDAMALPADDGNGRPIGFPVRAGQPAYLQIRVVNTGAEVLHAKVKINGNAYPAGMQVTEAGPFVTYSTKIALGPGSEAAPTTATVEKACPSVPKTAKFFSMSTHTFRHGTRTMIIDTPTAGATTTLFEGTDWQKPHDVSKLPTPFYSFTGSLTYHCEYANKEGASIASGDDARTDEICVTVGYFIPSPGGKGGFCLDGIGFEL